MHTAGRAVSTSISDGEFLERSKNSNQRKGNECSIPESSPSYAKTMPSNFRQ